MPLYEFSNDQGVVVERWMRGDEAVPCGKRVRLDGEWLTRIPSSGLQVTDRVGTPFLAHSRPDWWPYAKRHVQSGPDRGTPIFETRREAREAALRARASEPNHTGLEFDG